jgi:hypothetical protein
MYCIHGEQISVMFLSEKYKMYAPWGEGCSNENIEPLLFQGVNSLNHHNQLPVARQR